MEANEILLETIFVPKDPRYAKTEATRMGCQGILWLYRGSSRIIQVHSIQASTAGFHMDEGLGFCRDVKAVVGIDGDVRGLYGDRARICGTGLSLQNRDFKVFWVAARELKLSYYNNESMLFTIYPYNGNLV